MQGKKTHQEKLFVNFQLSDYVPSDNFYRQLKGILSLDFLYKSTLVYYGKEGQKSIDPVVFMKLMLVGYLENINSDRQIIRISSMRMDILFFLGYDLDEELPWHSTLSRTRKLYGEEHFLTLFKQVLKLCIDEGLISGKRQAVDSALIRANASINSMVQQEVMDDANSFSKELDANIDQEESKMVSITTPVLPLKSNSEKKREKKDYTNKTHYSPSDPDARITMKPGKPYDLYYRSQMSVDTKHHCITYIQAFPGNAADNTSLPKMLEQIVGNMKEHNIPVKEILADTGYASGEAFRTLIDHNIEGYIPNPGNYKKSREKDKFIYDPENDRYICQNGAYLSFRGFGSNHNREKQKKVYQSTVKDCRNCPFKSTCAGVKGIKKLTESIDKPLYDDMQLKIDSSKGKRMKFLRSSTVEPVFGSLINYTGLKRINTKGLIQASKCMVMAAVAYNLKKLLKHTKFKKAQSSLQQATNRLNCAFYSILYALRHYYTKNFSLQF